jgi:nucleoside-diphosphate-sugar epimerase
MRVSVTGATGFIGSAVVRELIDAGHRVTGLARSDQAAATLLAAGADVHRGSLADPDSLRAGAAAAEGVIHTAYIHDFTPTGDPLAAAQADGRAIEALGAALADTGRPLVVATGNIVTPGHVPTEDEAAPADAPHPRISEPVALRLADRGVRVSVVRLPPSVHGEGDHAFVPALIGIARATGVAAYVADGSNRWAAVHRLDAARLFRLGLEAAPAGARLHAIGDEGVRFLDIADVIGRHLGLPVRAIAPGGTSDQFGAFGMFAALDAPGTSALTRQRFGWQPRQPGLIADLEAGHYFKQ